MGGAAAVHSFSQLVCRTGYHCIVRTLNNPSKLQGGVGKKHVMSCAGYNNNPGNDTIRKTFISKNFKIGLPKHELMWRGISVSYASTVLKRLTTDRPGWFHIKFDCRETSSVCYRTTMERHNTLQHVLGLLSPLVSHRSSLIRISSPCNDSQVTALRVESK